MSQSQKLEIPGNDAASLDSSAKFEEDLSIWDLNERMLSWGRLWFGSSENANSSGENLRVRKRLKFWMDRCIGRNVHDLVQSQSAAVSLSTSLPLLAAFLGKRAALELSRRVLDAADDTCSGGKRIHELR